MQAWIEFGRGPLFRLAFCLMVLGLLRVVVLTIVGIAEAYRRNSDKIVPWKVIARQTLGWLVPVRRLWVADRLLCAQSGSPDCWGWKFPPQRLKRT